MLSFCLYISLCFFPGCLPVCLIVFLLSHCLPVFVCPVACLFVCWLSVCHPFVCVFHTIVWFFDLFLSVCLSFRLSVSQSCLKKIIKLSKLCTRRMIICIQVYFSRASAPVRCAHRFLGSLASKTGRCSPPKPPISALQFLPGILIIYRENFAKENYYGKNRQKCTASLIV
jgi:hypothetical protein